MLVDSHCHLNCLDLTDYDNDLDKAIAAIRAENIEHMLCVSIDLKTFPDVLAIAQKYDGITASAGLHPNDPINEEPTCDDLVKLADHEKVVAIGESGLDYFRSEGEPTWQQNRFREHIRASRVTKKPLIVHTREAKDDTIRIMQEENAQEVGGVMHCFTEDWEMAKQALDLNFMISFSGIVTFKNAKQLHDVAQKVPMDRLLIETDSPYLAPNPFRGKPNYPGYVKYVAMKIAELRGTTFEEVAVQSANNFYSLFGKN